MKVIETHDDQDLRCPECQSLDCIYTGTEDTEIYQCGKCDTLFGVRHSSHT